MVTESSAEQPRSPLPPADVPGYQLLRLIGRGSYGEVWLARDPRGNWWAVKVLGAPQSANRRSTDRELSGVRAFEPLSQTHPGLTRIVEIGTTSQAGRVYYVMEVADDMGCGQAITPERYCPHTLAQELSRDRRLPVSRCVELGLALGSALGCLHAHGLVHRDVKPSNILFVGGAPKLADAGLVTQTTTARSYVGTEGFIAPEGPGTVQADIYSLGKVLYEASTGKDRQKFPELPTLLDKTIHSREILELNRVIVRCCRPNPRYRYRSTRELLADLQRLKEGKPVRSRDPRHAWWRALCTAVLALLLPVAIAWLFADWLEKRDPPIPKGAVPAPAHLVAWWRGEDNTHCSPRRIPESLANRVAFAPGKIGKALAFGPNKSFLEVPPLPELRPAGAFTIEFWVKREELEAPCYIIEQGGDWTGGRTTFSISLDGAPSDYCLAFHFACGWRGAGRIADLNWHHCAIVVRDGEADPEFFVDGVREPVKRRRGPEVIRIMDSEDPIHIGAQVDPRSGYNYFSAKLIDELAIYTRALDELEVQMLASGGVSGKRLVGP